MDKPLATMAERYYNLKLLQDEFSYDEFDELLRLISCHVVKLLKHEEKDALIILFNDKSFFLAGYGMPTLVEPDISDTKSISQFIYAFPQISDMFKLLGKEIQESVQKLIDEGKLEL
jgi:hypothetical protein